MTKIIPQKLHGQFTVSCERTSGKFMFHRPTAGRFARSRVVLAPCCQLACAPRAPCSFGERSTIPVRPRKKDRGFARCDRDNEKTPRFVKKSSRGRALRYSRAVACPQITRRTGSATPREPRAEGKGRACFPPEPAPTGIRLRYIIEPRKLGTAR